MVLKRAIPRSEPVELALIGRQGVGVTVREV
jgi:hypothetical protein